MPEFKFKVGDRVEKVKGYKFPGVVDCAFFTQKGLDRYVVECDVPQVDGILHIYGPNDLCKTNSSKS
jgi:hypothetical protein